MHIGAIGFDPDAMFATLADLRMRFNSLLTMANKIPFPSNIAYFQKCSKLYQGVYMDDDTSMAQLYAFKPYSTWTFKEDYSDKGTGLVTTQIWDGQTYILPDAFLDILESQIQALLTSATLNYIYADVLRYCEKKSASLLSFTTVSEDYVAPIEYNPYVLLQINNSRPFKAPMDVAQTGYTINNDVLPNPDLNCITYRPRFSGGTTFAAMDAILNFQTDKPDTAMKIEATRYTPMIVGHWEDDNTFVSDECTLPDHYPTGIQIFKDNGLEPSFGSVSLTGSTAGVAAAQISRFNMHPLFFVYEGAGASKGNIPIEVFGDLNYFTVVDFSYMQRVNDLTMLGLFELR